MIERQIDQWILWPLTLSSIDCLSDPWIYSSFDLTKLAKLRTQTLLKVLFKLQQPRRKIFSLFSILH